MISKEKKAAIIEQYGRKAGDTGSPEVQIAILTARIAELTEHLKSNQKDPGDIQGTRPPCHGGGLGGKMGPYRGKTMPWRGETRAGEQRKWGETDGNKSLLRLGSYFLLIIYIAQERRKWPLRA